MAEEKSEIQGGALPYTFGLRIGHKTEQQNF